MSTKPAEPSSPVRTRSHSGTLTVNGSYSLSGGGTLAEVLTGTSSGQAAQIRVTGGAVNLQGGTLQIEPSGFGLAAGQSFTILTFTPGSLTGTFSTIADGPFTGSVNRVNVAGGLSLNVVYDNAAGDIRTRCGEFPDGRPLGRRDRPVERLEHLERGRADGQLRCGHR